MRKIYFLLTFFFISVLSFAQVSVNLLQPPPNQLKARDLWKGILINTTKTTLHITLFGTLEVAGEGIVIEGRSRMISLPPGTKRITYDDVVSGSVKSIFDRWGKQSGNANAPAGDYTIYLLVKAEDGREIGSSSIDQNIAEEETEAIIPQLISPADGSILDLSQPILFTWIVKSNNPRTSNFYKLKVVEILGNQSPSEAVKRNPTWYESNKLRTLMLQYPLSAKKLKPGKKYAWTVQIINKKTRGVDANSRTADAFMFTVEKTITETEAIIPQLITPADGSILDLSQPILFTWIVKSNNPRTSNFYKLKVVEILGNQSPSEAVKRNPTWYESNKLKTLMFQYPLSAKKLEPGKKYAWTVQIINKETRGVDENSGTADAFMFAVEKTITETEAIIPQLITPADGSTLNSKQPILFTWFVKSNNPRISNFYKLKVVKILDNQSPSEAVKQNPIWYESNKLRTLMFKYPLSAKKLEPGEKYAWTVQIINKETRGVDENSLTADAFMFTVEKTITETEAIIPLLITPADGSTLNSKQSILFTWMLPSIRPNTSNIYKIKLVEIFGKQSPFVAVKQNPAWFEKSDIKATMLQYPTSARELEPGKRYAWTVQLVDSDGQTLGNNTRILEVFIFDTEGENGITKSIPTDSTSSTDSTASTEGTGTAAVGDTIRAGLNGEFKVIVSQITTETDSSLTGQGKVHINWLGTNVAVEFKKIRIDTTKRLTSGGIVTSESGSSSTSYQTYPKAWTLSLLSGQGGANVVDDIMNWTNNKIDNIVNWTNGLNYGQPQINYQGNIVTPPPPPLEMPFGLQFNNGNQKLVITEMVFKPNESKINFLALEQFSKSGTVYRLGFVGKYFIIHPASIEFANGRVELAEDITIPNTSSNPKMKFNFKKGTTNSGSYIEWDSTGVKDISLGLEVKFTRDWLLPVPTSTDSVTATISGNGTSMDDILLSGSLPESEIVGTNGIKVLADSISLDLSDIRNPTGMNFPDNYQNNSTVTWKGFYIKSFGLTLPDIWKTGTDSTVVTASNIIIDDMGLTAKIKAVNVFDLQSGRVADLSASLDTVEISIINSSLINGTAKGKLVLPISQVTVQNSLNYKATFAQASGGNTFQIVILPVGPIDADVLKGEMTLSSTSNISATISPGSKTFSINLNGTFEWDNPVLIIPPASSNSITSLAIRSSGIKGIKMEMDFENLGLNYTNISNTNTLTFNPGTWSFASPPKWLANFPVTIKKIYYKSLTKVSPELVRGALQMDIVANLTETIGGSTTIGAAFAIEYLPDQSGLKKFVPKFKGVFIDSLAVHADLPAVKIDGYLKLFEDDPKFGSGFNAGIDVTFTAVSLQAKALVQFGNTTYQNNNQFYRYWRVEADVLLPVGIPFLTGVGFYGFGGGAYYNMTAIPKTTSAKVANAYTFEPKKGFKGLKVSATIGTLPKVETFNADVSLSAQFNNNNGLDLIYFAGKFWLATKLTDRPNSKINGDVIVSYTFPTKVFYMGANLNINVTENGTNVISTPPSNPVQFSMNIDGRLNKWYFKFGEPLYPNTVNVFTFSLYSYLMFGNDIPTPIGFTPRFQQKYFDAIGGYPTVGGNFGTGGVGPATKTGKGIATGVGIEFDKSYSQHLFNGLRRKWSIDAALKVGAELNLAFMDQTGSCPGINGYRASGNIGLYFNLTSTVTGKSRNINLWSDKSYNVFTIKIGSWLTGEFPNPVYLYGSVAGTINAMNDLISMQFSRSFTYGTSCTGTTVTVTNAAQEDKAGDLKNKLIQHVTPDTHFDFPITSTVNVKYALVPGQVFDVAENQGDGTIKNRTFKLVITKSLEVQNTGGAWAAKTLQTKVNNIGEWQYYIKAPLSTMVVQGSRQIGSSQIAHTLTTTLNTNNGNTLFASNGLFHATKVTFPVPPPPTPNYPNPIPDPVNNLVADKEYRFIVTATLMESTLTDVPNTGVNAGRGTGFHSEATWGPAKNRKGIAIKETKRVLFRTGEMPVAQVNEKK